MELSAGCLLLPKLSHTPHFSSFYPSPLAHSAKRHMWSLILRCLLCPLCPPTPHRCSVLLPQPLFLSLSPVEEVPGQCNWYSGTVRANAEPCQQNKRGNILIWISTVTRGWVGGWGTHLRLLLLLFFIFLSFFFSCFPSCFLSSSSPCCLC